MFPTSARQESKHMKDTPVLAPKPPLPPPPPAAPSVPEPDNQPSSAKSAEESLETPQTPMTPAIPAEGEGPAEGPAEGAAEAVPPGEADKGYSPSMAPSNKTIDPDEELKSKRR